METDKVVKRRGKRSEETHRIWVTFTREVFDTLSNRSKALGYTIGRVTRLTMDRAIACGLLTDDLPSLRGKDAVSKGLVDEYMRITKGAMQEDRERIGFLTQTVNLQQQRIDQMQEQIDIHKESIMEQAVLIGLYETNAVVVGHDPRERGR